MKGHTVYVAETTRPTSPPGEIVGGGPAGTG